ncbi:hypothetical protein ABZW11_00265 [Nonomuraea sp. NPDC004580]|uniref:hypothetical protein n=1 Tax=Nonomuraea sp. NPDC004580 TaxID=3154552 RepID=UPI0033B76575
MKRILTGVALATTAALVSATPALAAAPKNPVAAVKKQLAPGKGVKFTERTTLSEGRLRQVFVRRTGSLQFGKSGVAASDITGKINIKASDLEGVGDGETGLLLKALTVPERTIRVGTTSYLSGNIWSALLPEDKPWYKMPKGLTGGFTGTYGQPINVAEPVTLATLLKRSKATGSGYAGKARVADLWKVSPWLRSSWMDKPSAKAMKASISWKLTVDKAGRPTRLVTTYPTSVPGLGKTGSISVDTRYTGWGGKVVVKAPPADQVTTTFKNGEDDISSLELPIGSLAG